MFSKIITTIILFLMTWPLASGVVYATNPTTNLKKKPTLEELLPTSAPAENILINTPPPNPDDKDKAAKDKQLSEAVKTLDFWEKSLKPISFLPQGTESSIIAGIIRVVLAIGGTLATIGMLVAGVMYIIAQDNEDQVGKAKKILIYSIIGLITISVSFAIFTGLATLVFNN